MGLDALARLFGITGAFVSLYALSACIISQGGTQLSAVPGLEPGAPAQSAYFAIIVIGIALFVTSVIGIVHLRRPIGKTGWRFPIVGLGDTRIDNPRSWSVFLYVVFLGILFFVLPAFALVHLNNRLIQDGLVWNDALPASAVTGVACALPPWPFGACTDAADRTRAAAIFAVPSAKEDKLPGVLWLGSHRCDLAWERGLTGPQTAARIKDGGPPILQSELDARKHLDSQPQPIRAALQSFRPPRAEDGTVMVQGKDPTYCAGSRERSPLCKADESKCRGVNWIRFWSPALMVVSSLLGWIGSLAFLLLWLRSEHFRTEPRSEQAQPSSAEIDMPSTG